MNPGLHPREARALNALDVIMQRFASELPNAPATVTRSEIAAILNDLTATLAVPCGECGNTEGHFIACGACGACVFCSAGMPCVRGQRYSESHGKPRHRHTM
jgi:hypothetical protein